MPDDRQFVAALGRGLEILSCFRPERPLLNNGELATLTGLPRSSVSRLTHTLIKLGYLDYDTSHGTYRLGFQVLSLHTAMLAGTDMHALVLPHIKRLAEIASARVLLATCQDRSMVVIQGADKGHRYPPRSEVGAQYAIYGSAMGRAYLASCSSIEQSGIISRLTKSEGHDPARLRLEVEMAVSQYQKHGYCVSLNAWRQGVHGVAIPIYLRNLGHRVVLACGGAASRLTQSCLEQKVVPLLLQSADDIKHAFAGASSRAAVHGAGPAATRRIGALQ